MNHIPNYFLSGSIPGIMPFDFFFVYDFHIGFCGRKFTVKWGSGYFNFRIVFETLGGFFHYGKCFGKNFHQDFFFYLVSFFVELIYLLIDAFFVIKILSSFCFLFQIGNLFFLCFGGFCQFGFEFGCFGSQFVIGKRFYLLFSLQCFFSIFL